MIKNRLKSENFISVSDLIFVLIEFQFICGYLFSQFFVQFSKEGTFKRDVTKWRTSRSENGLLDFFTQRYVLWS